jgi:recombination protein RecA
MTDDARQQAEEHRRRVIRAKVVRLENSLAPVREAIPTGFPALDEVLGIGGFPRGAMTELFGPSSSGKTTLALQWVAHLQASALEAAWIDADHTFDPAYAAALGVALERVPLARPESAEQALEMTRRLAMSGAVDAVIVDSVAALAPQLELDSAMTGSAGLHGRVLASGLKPLARAVAKSDTAVLFLNQTRSRMDPSAGGMETSAGGPALKLYAAVRLVLEPVDSRTVRFRTLKNKAAAAFREGVLRRGGPLGFAKTP